MASNPVGDKKIRSIPISVRTAFESAVSAKDAVDMPIIYDVQAKYVEVFGQIESVNYDASSLVCLVDDGTARIPLKQYFEQPVLISDESNPFASFVQGAFVYAVGALRTGNDPYVSINQIRVVSSANEIACTSPHVSALSMKLHRSYSSILCCSYRHSRREGRDLRINKYEIVLRLW